MMDRTKGISVSRGHGCHGHRLQVILLKEAFVGREVEQKQR